VGLDDPRLGIHREQRAQLEQVARRLEQPALAALALLERLQEAPVVAIGGTVVGLGEVGLVGGHVVAATPLVGQELVHRDEDALVGQVARVGVHRLVLGLEVVPEGRLRVADLAQGVARERLDRVLDLPHRGRAVRGIEREQLVQDRGARARAADHEHGREDRLAQDLGPLPPQLGELEPVAQRAHDLRARDETAGEGQPRLALERLDEQLEVGAPLVAAEVVEPRAHARGREQLLRVERHERGRAAHGRAVRVQALHPARSSRRLPRHARPDAYRHEFHMANSPPPVATTLRPSGEIRCQAS
jgi:hypothetical protein